MDLVMVKIRKKMIKKKSLKIEKSKKISYLMDIFLQPPP